mmetsp:Transcript_10768/g.12419  ORF Transcript_10768/g.12419 Transcript_10768/m.12419 type:complete len:973 (+) Transcript_10768:333-3251(+)
MDPVPELLDEVDDETNFLGLASGDSAEWNQSDTHLEESWFEFESAAKENVYYKLMHAAQTGNERKVKECLESLTVAESSALDTRPNFPSYGESPLHRAKSIEISRLLIEKGVSVNLKGGVGQTPLHTQCDNLECTIFLIENGATVDSLTEGGSTPLLWASVADCLPVVKVLVRHGADVNHQNDNGNTALHICSSVQVAKYLIRHRARLDITNINGNIPLEEAAAKGNSEKQVKLASYLLDVSHDLTFEPEDSEEPVALTGRTIDSRKFQSWNASSSQESFRKVLTAPVNDSEAYPIESHNIHQNVEILDENSQNHDAPVNSPILLDPARKRWDHLRGKVLNKTRRTTPRASILPQRRGSRRRRTSLYSVGSVEGDGGSVGTPMREQYDEFYLAFFELMVKDRPELALKILDKQRIFLYAKNSQKIYSYNISLIGTPTTSSTVLRQIVENKRRELVAHEVVQWVLNVKWVLFTRYTLAYEFVRYLCFTLLFVCTSIFGEWSVMARGTEHNNIWISSVWLLSAEILLFLLNSLYIFNYVSQLLKHRYDLRYYFSIHTGVMIPVHLLVAVEQFLRTFNSNENEDIAVAANIVGGFAAVLVWMKLMSFGESFQLIGVMFFTVQKMVSDIIPYFLLLCGFLMGFSHAMALLYRDAETNDYGTIGDSWITLFFFVFNLDVTSLNEERVQYRKYFGYLFVAIYMLVVALVITNLIIAVMTNTFEDIQKNSREEWLLQRARVALKIEDTVENRLFSSYWHSLPEGKSKILVHEESDGTVLLEVSKQWLNRVVSLRDSGVIGKLSRIMFRFLVNARKALIALGVLRGNQSSEFFLDGDEVTTDDVAMPDTQTPLLGTSGPSYRSTGYKSTSAKGALAQARRKRLSAHFSSTDAGVNRTGIKEETVCIGMFSRCSDIKSSSEPHYGADAVENDEGIHNAKSSKSTASVASMMRDTLKQLEKLQGKIIQLEIQQSRMMERLKQ